MNGPYGRWIVHLPFLFGFGREQRLSERKKSTIFEERNTLVETGDLTA
jgi:hypothetical protein